MRGIDCTLPRRARQPRLNRTALQAAVDQTTDSPDEQDTTPSVDSLPEVSHPQQDLPTYSPGFSWSDTSEPATDWASDVLTIPDLSPQADHINQQSTGNPLNCTCVDELLDTVQKLDDDEFHIRTLTFDQVLKLQKFLLFQCLRPIDCARCMPIPRVHTLILVVCERVTEMFRCLCRRLGHVQPFKDGISELEAQQPRDGTNSHAFFSFKNNPNSFSHWGFAQIFDGESGEEGIAVVCNPEMFSHSFREQYSVEEQFQMIRVLARIQIKNFKQLLARISDMPQSRKSPARTGKVQALSTRFDDIATAMEELFEVVLRDIGCL